MPINRTDYENVTYEHNVTLLRCPLKGKWGVLKSILSDPISERQKQPVFSHICILISSVRVYITKRLKVGRDYETRQKRRRGKQRTS